MTISALPTHIWEFDGNGNDLVGSMHHTLSGSPPTTGKPVYGLQSDVSSASRAAGYNLGAGAWSITQWIKTAASTSDYQGGGWIGDINFYLHPLGDTAAVSRYSSGSPLNLSASVTISVNTWYLVAATRSSDGVVKLYVNGSLVATGSSATFTDDMGESFFGEPNGYPATIGQTAIYEGEWTADDISYIYNAGSGLAYASWEETPTEPGPDVRVDAILSDMVIRL